MGIAKRRGPLPYLTHASHALPRTDAKCKSPSSLGIQGYGHGTKDSIPPLCHLPSEVVSDVLFGRFTAEGANHGTQGKL